jgi:preprotein translocase subunit SecA
MSLLNKILGDPNQKVISRLRLVVDEINLLEPELQKLTDQQIKEKSLKLKDAVRAIKDFEEQNRYLDQILPETFALVREASKRTLKMRHFDVQMLGGIVLHRGMIAEMMTGEGKTLVATLPLYLNSLTGRGAHLITVNDYLARAHTEWMGPIYNFLGMTVGCINHESSFIYQPVSEKQIQDDANEGKQANLGEINSPNLKTVSRKEAYDLDITYGTNNEFGFDYLRDNMAQTLDRVAQKELNFAIVDEVDSILIDEARTPLIISSPTNQAASMYQQFAGIVPKLKKETDYLVDEKDKAVSITDSGIKKVESILGLDNIYSRDGVMLVHHLEEALKAQALFKKNRDYIVKEGEVVIVDEFTGRMMPGRRYSEGLHQAIEAKEGVEIKQESMTMATISFQNLFRIYKKLAGMTGTALTEAEEFYKIYKLEVVAIPTNKKLVRKDLQDQIYKTEDAKYQAIVTEIKKRYLAGQPVLVGTVSVSKNEMLSRLLKKEGIKHQILNAKHHDREAKIVARAGELKAVTVATNMAGRGTDIRLSAEVLPLGGLCVIGTERHESRRIDNQLRGRAGRQGDPGSSIFFVSMEDDLMRIFGGERMKNLMNALGLPDDLPIENKMISKSIESAQRKVEGHNFDIRKHLVEYDDVINKHREVIYRKRRRILLGENEKRKNEFGDIESIDLKSEIFELIDQEIEVIVNSAVSDQDKIIADLKALFGDQFQPEKIDTDSVKKSAKEFYEEREKNFGSDLTRQIEQSIYLRSLDMLWVEHLTAMEELRAGIGLLGYGQKDPLVEYKAEAYNRFQDLMATIESTVIRNIFKVEVKKEAPAPLTAAKSENLKFSGAKESAAGGGFAEGKREIKKTVVNKEKVGRNDPCPCGATNPDGTPKKYKKCCGR